MANYAVLHLWCGRSENGVPDVVWDWEQKASLQNTCLSLLCELSCEQGMKAGLLDSYSHRTRESFTQISQATVVFKPQWHQRHLVGLLKHRSEPHPHNFWFSRSGVGPEHLHFWQTPQWCWCCYSRGPHLENHWVRGWFDMSLPKMGKLILRQEFRRLLILEEGPPARKYADGYCCWKPQGRHRRDWR